MAREYFCAYHSFLKSVEPLSDAERGRLFTVCLEYSKTGIVPELRGNERFIFPTIKYKIDYDNSVKKKRRDRDCEEYKTWRKSVFKRDNYTCQNCNTRGEKINAHHIIRFADEERLRYELSNGITLCIKCHKKAHR